MMRNLPPIRAYLLHQLSDPERERVEELLFEDDSFFDLVREEEDSLLDEYLRGRMSSPDRDAFEKRLSLSADLRARLQMRKAFSAARREKAEAGTFKSHRSNFWSPILTAVAIGSLAACFICGVWLVKTMRALQEARTQIAAASRPALISPPPSMHATAAAVIFLTASETRGATSIPVFSLDRRGQVAEIEVQLPNEPIPRGSIQLTLRRDGETLLQLAHASARSAGPVAYVSAYLPAEVLTPGTYEIKIVSNNPIDESTPRIFRIQKN